MTTDPEQIGRETAERLGVEPTGTMYPVWPTGLPLAFVLSGWSDDANPYTALGNAVLACRAACGYDEQAKRLEEVEAERDKVQEYFQTVRRICERKIQEKSKLYSQLATVTAERDAALARCGELEAACQTGWYTATLLAEELPETAERHAWHDKANIMASLLNRKQTTPHSKGVSMYDQLKRDAEYYMNNPIGPATIPSMRRLARFGVEMLPFADDSPITEEALRAEGFTVGDDAYSPVGGGTWLERYNGQWFWHQTLFATLGQLRHLLAAMKLCH